ncbi:MAG: hypothetical protein A4E63_00919 [Syntrophorhabdus sp. PtaU1.Bin050]|jgi:hypothetical protein|nr:MAG: hypothetical protein A4E63_00919 [Syntrophorhabdus sp. PtaU1.Bin050]
MFVRSTGLGRTLLRGRIARIVTTNIVPSTLEPPANGTKEPMRLLMEMEILHPVHWTVRAFVDPPDLREMIMHVITNPGLILNGIKFLFMKGPKYEDLPATHAAAPAAAAGPAKGPAPVPKGPAPIPK